jgi:hypothetical protein
MSSTTAHAPKDRVHGIYAGTKPYQGTKSTMQRAYYIFAEQLKLQEFVEKEGASVVNTPPRLMSLTSLQRTLTALELYAVGRSYITHVPSSVDETTVAADAAGGAAATATSTGDYSEIALQATTSSSPPTPSTSSSSSPSPVAAAAATATSDTGTLSAQQMSTAPSSPPPAESTESPLPAAAVGHTATLAETAVIYELVNTNSNQGICFSEFYHIYVALTILSDLFGSGEAFTRLKMREKLMAAGLNPRPGVVNELFLVGDAIAGRRRDTIHLAEFLELYLHAKPATVVDESRVVTLWYSAGRNATAYQRP